MKTFRTAQSFRIEQHFFNPETRASEAVPISYELIRSSRKSISIQILAGGKIRVRAPWQAPVRNINEFLQEKRSWILRKKEELSEKEKIVSSLSPEQYAALEKRYRRAASDYIPLRAEYYAAQLNVHYSRISIRCQKTRWGSCSSSGTLSFNWKLMLAPPAVLDYVIVHEVCHLLEMNHSPAFWQLVSSVLPDYEEKKKWLKENGHLLELH